MVGQVDGCVDVNYSEIRGRIVRRRVGFMVGKQTEESETKQRNI
jgi:hypothetical protein